MAYIKLLWYCYYVCKSLTFVASQLASLILEDKRNQVTNTTSYLPTRTLIKWIRNGKKFTITQCETMNVLSVTDGFSVSYSSFEFFIKIRSWQFYARVIFLYFTFKFLFVRV